MVSKEKLEQYRGKAVGWSEREYADGRGYLEHRADLVIGLGQRLAAGDIVLDLACGDGGLGKVLLGRGLAYRGVDLTSEMAEAAGERLGGRATVDVGDLNTYVPPQPVAATTLFRALYYVADRRAFFAHARAYTTRKLVFDLNPRQYRVADVIADLHAVGWEDVVLQPFFFPQTRALPGPVGTLLRLLERAGPLARVLLRWRFTIVVAAS